MQPCKVWFGIWVAAFPQVVVITTSTFPRIQTRHRNQGCKEIYPFWRAVQHCLQRLKKHIPMTQPFHFWKSVLRENCVQGDIYKENICNSTRVEQPTLCREMGKLWFIHTTDKSNFHILRFGKSFWLKDELT